MRLIILGWICGLSDRPDQQICGDPRDGAVADPSIDVLPPLLNFRYGENRGINFGLFDGGSERALDFDCSGTCYLLGGVLGGRVNAQRKWRIFSAGLADRRCAWPMCLTGWFMAMCWISLNIVMLRFNNPFVFNVADVFIFAGALG